MICAAVASFRLADLWNKNKLAVSSSVLKADAIECTVNNLTPCVRGSTSIHSMPWFFQNSLSISGFLD